MLKIYGNKTFNAVKAVLAAEEAGVDYEYVVVDLQSGAHKALDYMKIHPLGKIPALEHNGNAMFESNNMCRYIANISDSDLYSKDAVEAAKIDQTVDFIGYHAGRWITVYFFEEIVKTVLMGGAVNPTAIEEAEGFLKEQLTYMDGLLEGNDFLCGDHLTIADCVAFAMIMTHEYTSFDISEYNNICRWYEQIKVRPSFDATMQHFPGGYDFTK